MSAEREVLTERDKWWLWLIHEAEAAERNEHDLLPGDPEPNPFRVIDRLEDMVDEAIFDNPPEGMPL